MSEYVANNTCKDGLNPWCRSCRSESQHKSYWQDPEKYRKIAREYSKSNPEKVSAYFYKKYEKSPEKYSALSATAYRIETGELKKELCLLCGAKEVEAHHVNYFEPLNVAWLCRKCHGETHRRLRKSVFNDIRKLGEPFLIHILLARKYSIKEDLIWSLLEATK